jgi:SAM-dependent methyltransferase
MAAMAEEAMGKFWDERAREDAYFFIDNRREYRDGELDSFWANGEADLDTILAEVDAKVEPSDVALDIGCGAGRLTRVLAGRAKEVYGIDVSSEMIARAREHNAHLTNVQWFHGDGVSLAPLPDATFDECISHVVFQHIPDPQVTYGYVKEIGRVLKPGGWAVFQVSNDPSIHVARDSGGLRERLATARGKRPGGQDNPAWLGSAVEMPKLREAAEAGGLTLERVVGEGTQYCMILARR